MQGARSPKQHREQLQAVCQHDVDLHAQTSYYPRDHKQAPDLNSVSDGGLLTDDRQVCHQERSSGLLANRTDRTKMERFHNEDAKICHDRRFSKLEGNIPVHTLQGDVSSPSQ